MEKETKKRRLKYLLIISLIIHAFSICVIFRYSFQKHTKDLFQKIAQYLSPEEVKKKKEEKKEQQQKIMQALQNLQPQHKKLAALKPKKSTFGWVMFDDPAPRLNPETVDVPTTIDGMPGQSLTADATEEKVDNKKIKKIIKENKSKPARQAANKPKPNITKPKSSEQTVQAITQEPQKEEPNKDKRIEDIKKLQEKLESLKDEKKPMAQARGAQSIEAKPKRNIIALTKGFVENLKDEGDDPIKRDGDESIKASFEDLKYLSYETKINWCLQAAWKQNFAHTMLRRPMEGKAIVEMIIDKHGKLVKNTLLESTGNPELDRMIMQSTQQATPFPPLPKHFGTDVYTTGRIIHVTTNRYSL